MRTVKVELGQKYITRNGSLVGPATEGWEEDYPFRLYIPIHEQAFPYTKNGEFYGPSSPHDFDLIEKIPNHYDAIKQNPIKKQTKAMS